MPEPLGRINHKVVPFLDDLGRRQRWWRSEARKTAMLPKDLGAAVNERSASDLCWGLRLFFPEDGIVGEELTPDRADAPRVWVVDPLDGTRNYAHGLALWGISVALFEEGRPIAGAYHMPDAAETFVAVQGEGAWFNGERLRTPSWAGPDAGDIVSIRGSDAPRALRRGILRRLGCVGAELCYLAAGRLAGVHLAGPRLWDVAAAGLIAQEAGSTVGFLDGGDLWPWSVHEPTSARSLVAWPPGMGDPREPADPDGRARTGTPWPR